MTGLDSAELNSVKSPVRQSALPEASKNAALCLGRARRKRARRHARALSAPAWSKLCCRNWRPTTAAGVLQQYVHFKRSS